MGICFPKGTDKLTRRVRAQLEDRPELHPAIDIGGPAMIRAAAKNHAHVTVVVDPEDYCARLSSGEEMA